MNSKDRRRDRRKWRHIVVVNYDDSADWWVDFCAMWDWCLREFGDKVETCGWRTKHESVEEWQFDCSKKAMLFALRWR